MKSNIMIGSICAVFLMTAPPLYGQEAADVTERKIAYVNKYGDILHQTKRDTRRFNARGWVHAVTGDYFRGSFDGVPEELDDFAVKAGAAGIFDVSNSRGFMEKSSLTVGVDTGFSDEDPLVNVDNWEIWYEADVYAGLTGQIIEDVIGGITYTLYESPNDGVDEWEEIALTVTSDMTNALGSWKPYGKIAFPISGRDGEYYEIGIHPQFLVQRQNAPASARPVTVRVPVRLGLGTNDYYGDATDDAVFGSAGVFGYFPMPFLETGQTEWTFMAGIKVIAREEKIITAQPLDTGSETVGLAKAGFEIGF